MSKIMVITFLINQLFTSSAYSKQDENSSFVAVSRRDPRYFELSNGSPYIPIGFNLIGPPRGKPLKRKGDMGNSRSRQNDLGNRSAA